MKDIERALAYISSERDYYKKRHHKQRHREIVAIKYLEAFNHPTPDGQEIFYRTKDVLKTFGLYPSQIQKAADLRRSNRTSDDNTSTKKNFEPKRIPVSAHCPHRPRVPEHLVAAKVLLHSKYRPKTPLLKTIMWRKMRYSLAEGFREATSQQFGFFTSKTVNTTE